MKSNKAEVVDFPISDIFLQNFIDDYEKVMVESIYSIEEEIHEIYNSINRINSNS